MSFRSIMVESSAKISVKGGMLIIDTGVTHSVPVEDISALMLENKTSVITAAALSRLGQSGCAVYVCDDRHLPCAVLTPFACHSRWKSVIDAQLGASLPAKKRLRGNLPDNGSVRALVITEKQYEAIEIMLGKLTEADEPFQCEQLTIF